MTERHENLNKMKRCHKKQQTNEKKKKINKVIPTPTNNKNKIEKRYQTFEIKTNFFLLALKTNKTYNETYHYLPRIATNFHGLLYDENNTN